MLSKRASHSYILYFNYVCKWLTSLHSSLTIQLNSILSIDLTTFQLEQMEKSLMVFRVHTSDQRNQNKFKWNMSSEERVYVSAWCAYTWKSNNKIRYLHHNDNHHKFE